MRDTASQPVGFRFGRSAIAPVWIVSAALPVTAGPVALASSNAPNFPLWISLAIPASVLLAALLYRAFHRNRRLEPPATPEGLDVSIEPPGTGDEDSPTGYFTSRIANGYR